MDNQGTLLAHHDSFAVSLHFVYIDRPSFPHLGTHSSQSVLKGICGICANFVTELKRNSVSLNTGGGARLVIQLLAGGGR